MFKHRAINKCLILWWVRFIEDYLSSGSNSSDGGNVSAWVFTVDNSTVPGERLGPGESLCDDQRWGRLAPITLILHPLQETSGDAIKTSPHFSDGHNISCMNIYTAALLHFWLAKKGNKWRFKPGLHKHSTFTYGQKCRVEQNLLPACVIHHIAPVHYLPGNFMSCFTWNRCSRLHKKCQLLLSWPFKINGSYYSDTGTDPNSSDHICFIQETQLGPFKHNPQH